MSSCGYTAEDPCLAIFTTYPEDTKAQIRELWTSTASLSFIHLRGVLARCFPDFAAEAQHVKTKADLKEWVRNVLFEEPPPMGLHSLPDFLHDPVSFEPLVRPAILVPADATKIGCVVNNDTAKTVLKEGGTKMDPMTRERIVCATWSSMTAKTMDLVTTLFGIPPPTPFFVTTRRATHHYQTFGSLLPPRLMISVMDDQLIDRERGLLIVLSLDDLTSPGFCLESAQLYVLAACWVFSQHRNVLLRLDELPSPPRNPDEWKKMSVAEGTMPPKAARVIALPAHYFDKLGEPVSLEPKEHVTEVKIGLNFGTVPLSCGLAEGQPRPLGWLRRVQDAPKPDISTKVGDIYITQDLPTDSYTLTEVLVICNPKLDCVVITDLLKLVVPSLGYRDVDKIGDLPVGSTLYFRWPATLPVLSEEEAAGKSEGATTSYILREYYTQPEVAAEEAVATEGSRKRPRVLENDLGVRREDEEDKPPRAGAGAGPQVDVTHAV